MIFKLLHRTFFKTRYGYQRILKRYSHALTTPMTDLNRFCRLVPYLLVKSMEIKEASVLALDRKTGSYVLRAGEKDARDLEGLSLPGDSPLLAELIERRRVIALEEIESLVKTCPGEKDKYEKIAAQMKRLKAALIIACVSKSEYFNKPTVLATVNLGQKLSGRSYTRDDIDFLSALADKSAASIEHSFIFEELKKKSG